MHVRARLLGGLLISTLLSFVCKSSEASTLTVTYDQLLGTLTAMRDRQPVAIPPGGTLKVPPGTQVVLAVTNTNTALYQCSTSATEEAAPEAVALKQYLGVFQPYAADLLSRSLPSQGLMDAQRPKPSKELTDVYKALDSLHAITLAALSALDAQADTARFEAVRLAFRDRMTPELESDAQRLVVGRKLVKALDDLALATRDDPDVERRKPAADLLARTESILVYLRDVESLVAAVRSAKRTWSDTLGSVAATKTRAISLTVTPRKGSLQAGLAGRPAYTANVRVAPRWFLQPNVGLGLLVSPGSEFTTYEMDRSGATPVPVPTGSFDSRVTYGLSLALTPEPLHELNAGCSLWLAEVTINPSDEVRAIGLGFAISRGLLKLSAGWLWTRHQVATGTQIDETYGSPEGFVGLAVSGWLE